MSSIHKDEFQEEKYESDKLRELNKFLKAKIINIIQEEISSGLKIDFIVK